jgi:hypothetical protein
MLNHLDYGSLRQKLLISDSGQIISVLTRGESRESHRLLIICFRYQNEFEDGAQSLREIKSLEDLSILKKATIIGMTTTGTVQPRVQPKGLVTEAILNPCTKFKSPPLCLHLKNYRTVCSDANV